MEMVVIRAIVDARTSQNMTQKSGFVIGAYDEGYRTISNPISESG